MKNNNDNDNDNDIVSDLNKFDKPEKKFNSKEKFTLIAIIIINFGISLIDIGFRKIFRENRR